MAKMQAARVRQGMETNNFNSEATGPRYTYRPSPVHERSFMILKYADGPGHEPLPVGDYTVLDTHEERGLSEKKVMNLVSLLNGRKALMQLGHETNARVLYNVVTDSDDDGKALVIFYHLGKEGVSVENALFRIERDSHVV